MRVVSLRVLRKHGQPVGSSLDAQRRFSDGDRIFLFHDMDEQPTEVTSVEQLRSYAPDQMLALPTR